MYGRSSELGLYQTYTSAYLFDTLVPGLGDVGDINGLNVGNPGVGSQGSLLANRFLLLMTKNSENNVFVIGL